MSPSFDEIRARARAWTEPVSAESPSGALAKREPAYEAVTIEVAKLESPASGAVSWDQVVRDAGGLLQRSTKDLWLAAYLGYGLYATEGLTGAATGAALLAELSEHYWPSMFPEASRPRGRANALLWFVERLSQALPGAKVESAQRPELEMLAAAAKRLADVSREKLNGSSPAFGPLLEAVERLRASMPEEPRPAPAAEPVAPELATAASTPEPAPQAPSVPTPPVPAAAAPVPELPDAGGTTEFLRNVGSALASAAVVARRADAADPLSYRILRAGLWLHLEKPPAAGANGRTPVPPMPAALKTKLERLADNQKWAELLEEAECAMPQHRFSLDLQRHSAAALARLGDAHAAARDTVLRELGALLRRMPGVVELTASDGSPLSDEKTRAWLDAEVRARPASAPLPAPLPALEGEEDGGGLESRARALVAENKQHEAFALLQDAVTASPSGRARFLARLRLARLCADVGQRTLAQNLYESLEREGTALGLDAWEPKLAAACLEGCLLLVRTGVKAGNPAPAEFWARYQRLAQLDPVSILRLEI